MHRSSVSRQLATAALIVLRPGAAIAQAAPDSKLVGSTANPPAYRPLIISPRWTAPSVKAKIVFTGNFEFPGAILSRPGINSVEKLEGEKSEATAIGSMEYTVARGFFVDRGGDFSNIVT
jgi:hypothetical protein